MLLMICHMILLFLIVQEIVYNNTQFIIVLDILCDIPLKDINVIKSNKLYWSVQNGRSKI